MDVIRVEAEQLPLTQMEQPRLKAVFDHWNAVRGDRRMPARRDIDPLALKAALGIVMIARHVPELDDYRFSLYGSEVVGVQHTDYTNKLASQLEPPAYGEVVLQSYRRTRAAGEPYFGRISLSIDHELVSYNRLVLPLGDDGETADALLTASEHERALWQTLNEGARRKASGRRS